MSRAVPKANTGFRLTVDLLDRLDEQADKVGMTRNAYLTALCEWDFEHVTKDGYPSWWDSYNNPPQGTLPLS